MFRMEDDWLISTTRTSGVKQAAAGAGTSVSRVVQIIQRTFSCTYLITYDLASKVEVR
jgi:hypothetical protein